MTKYEQMENIHNNLVNGNRQDCVKLIKKYGHYDFWNDYKNYLDELFSGGTMAYEYFTDMTISYFRITNR